MAKAALKDELTFPAGGIADFYKTDAELEAMDREDAQREFGESGIANFEEVATRMASYGRYGDDTLAHVETGEIVVPKALIEQNPKLKESIFGHLREMGIEDPERYVVGSSENSLNPETGMPEFFLKKIFKGVKKALSGVGKVLKKAAPIILPIALAMTPLGPVYGAALGSGIGTLAQGGSMKDAFKSALIAGGTGALFAGASAKFGGTGTFSEGVSKAFADPGARFSQTLSGAGQTLSGQGFTGQGNLFSEYVPATPSSATMASQTPAAQVESATQLSGNGTTTVGPDEFGVNRLRTASTGTGTTPTVQPYEQTGFFENLSEGNIKEAFLPSGPTPDQVALAQGEAYKSASQAALQSGASEAAAAEAGKLAMQQVTASSMGPGMIASYGPAAALGGAGLYAAGFFDTPEEPPEEEMITGADLLAQDPGKYSPGGYQVTAAQGPYTVATNYGYVPQPIPAQPPVNPFLRPIGVAEGGEIFPRRVGGIMPDEGIPGQDSVRAMLMPGEFVMTTNAVKGLGDGNNQVGINRMYDMMRGLEAKGKAMA